MIKVLALFCVAIPAAYSRISCAAFLPSPSVSHAASLRRPSGLLPMRVASRQFGPIPIDDADSTRLVLDLPDVKVLEQPFFISGIDVRNRMSLLKLKDGKFLAYSVLQPTKQCVDKVRELTKNAGPAYLFLPNGYPEHCSTAKAWRAEFPAAIILSVPESVNVIAEFMVSGAEDLPAELKGQVDVAMFQSPLVKEAVMVHKASKTLLVADSAFEITDDYTPTKFNSFVVKLQGLDRFTTPIFFRFGIQGGKDFLSKIEQWDFTRIVTAHTALVLEGDLFSRLALIIMLLPDDRLQVGLYLFLSAWEVVMPFLCVYVFPRAEFSSPPPFNASYEHMTIAVFLSLAAVNILIITPGSPFFGFPVLSYRDMQMALLTVYGFTCLHVGCRGAAAVWLFAAAILWAYRFYRGRQEWEETVQVYGSGFCLGKESTSWLRRSPLPPSALALRVIQTIICIVFWAGPVLMPWDKPAPFVRWHPYNKLGEMLWRSLFATFGTYLLVASADPWLLNRGITGFFVIQSIVHASTMLGDNILATGGNDNVGHLVGDILAWYVIGLLHLGLGPWKEWWSASQGDQNYSIAGEASKLVYRPPGSLKGSGGRFGSGMMRASGGNQKRAHGSGALPDV